MLQQDWAVARLKDWAAVIDGAIRAGGASVFIIAHGFGCLAAVRRLAECRMNVAGAMLVAPRDPSELGVDGPTEPFAIPTTLVASRNDPWMPFVQAKGLAQRLGSRFVDAGEAGHIDAAAGYGPWRRGEQRLARLVVEAQARERELRLAIALAT